MNPSLHNEPVLLVSTARRRILKLLTNQEFTAGQVARMALASRPATSQHLQILLAAGLITCRKDKTRRWYQTDNKAVWEFFSRMWDEAGGN